jgi:hypothetical protein
MSEQGGETTELGKERTSSRSAELSPAQQKPLGTGANSAGKQKPTGRRKMLLLAAGVPVLAGALWFWHSLGPDDAQHSFDR